MKRQASVLVNVPNDPNPRRKQKPKLRRQGAQNLINPPMKPTSELKLKDVGLFTDTPNVGAPTPWSALTLLNGLQLGSDYTNRIGRKVLWKKLHMHYTATNVGGPQRLRLLCVYDKQPNGLTPLITDILLTDDYPSFNNLNNRDRFITIFDEITENASVDQMISHNITRKINLETVFNGGNAGTIADISTGAIWFMACQPFASLNVTDSFARFRLRFNDM